MPARGGTEWGLSGAGSGPVGGTLRTSAKKEFNGTLEGMRFLLEVSMDDEAWAKDPVGELGRILRYWGGNLRHYPMKAGDGSKIYDSEYREVGRWRIEQGAGDEREGAA